MTNKQKKNKDKDENLLSWSICRPTAYCIAVEQFILNFVISKFYMYSMYVRTVAFDTRLRRSLS